MPGAGGRYRWEFVGRPRTIFVIVFVLLASNVTSSLALGLFGKHLIPRGISNAQNCPALASAGVQFPVPHLVCWYADWDIFITFILLGLGALIMLIYRKDVRRVR